MNYPELPPLDYIQLDDEKMQKEHLKVKKCIFPFSIQSILHVRENVHQK